MAIHEFGIKLEGIDYIDRPSVYAVIENSCTQIAAIKTSPGYFLTGGGIDSGEAVIDALKREILEEIGYQVTVLGKIGEAAEYIKAYSDEKYYQIHSWFYKVQLDSKNGEGVEKDHQLVWLLPEDAAKLLVRQSQGWALQIMVNE